MISNQILQNTIDGLKAITRTDLCVIDVEGKILVATFPDAEQFVAPAQTFVESPADSQVVNLKCSMIINWSIFCWHMETARMCI